MILVSIIIIGVNWESTERTRNLGVWEWLGVNWRELRKYSNLFLNRDVAEIEKYSITRSFILFSDGIEHVLIIAVGAVFIRLFESDDVLPKHLSAFLAGKCHLSGLLESVVRHFVMAVGALEPFLAAGRSDGSLDIENMLAHIFNLIQIIIIRVGIIHISE